MVDNRGGAFTRWILPFCACALAACGARSSLLEGHASPANTGGAGGTSSTSSTSNASSTGSTSSSSTTTSGMPACLPLAVTGPDLTLPAAGNYHARRPAIAELADGPTIALVFGLDAVESPGPVPSPIANVAFDPWGAWPPAMDPPHQVAGDGGAAFAVARREGGKYALLASGAIGSSPGWMRADADVDPAGSADLKDLPQKGSAVFLAARPNKLMFGHAAFQGSPPLYAGGVAVITPLDPFTPISTSGACGTGGLVGDAIRHGNGFLAAMSTNIPVLNCLQGLGSGPAVDVRIFRGDPNEKPDDILLAHPVERIRLTKRSQGAWIVSQTRDFDGNLEPLRADAITGEGHADQTLAQIHPVSGPASGFAAAPFGDGFALAWIINPTTLGVGVFDPKGAALATTTFPLAAPALSPLALVSADDRSALLVAWSQESFGEAAAVHVARFGCLEKL